MKKYIKYILILTILFGFLNPIYKTNAQTPAIEKPKGTCITEKKTYENWDEASCKAQGDKANWVAYYQYLAPLPNPDGGATDIYFNPRQDNAISVYLNVIIKIIIGLAAVMAVVMIVIGGIQYMTTELMSSKEEGKSRITGAIFGLVLAIGSWALLNTINPDLLKGDVDIKEAKVSVVLQEDHETLSDSISNADPVAGPIPGCPDGVVKEGPSYITICKSISSNVNTMFTKAAESNIPLSGGGFRSKTEQEYQRRIHCNGNITDPNAPCTPPTAVPGSSRHENGLALDLKCGNNKVQKNDTCYNWLVQNAGTYKLYNLNGEPWHWSTDGH